MAGAWQGRAWYQANRPSTSSSFLDMATGTSANRFRGFLLLAALIAVAGTAGRAQNTNHPTESPQMRQLHQALILSEHGDKQEAMNLVVQLLEEHPDFAPALKLKGMLLEEAGRGTAAAAAY